MKKNIFLRIFDFYYQGFKNMSRSSKTLWIIILVKLFIMFVILKIFLMPDFLGKNFNNDKERGEFVLEELSHHHTLSSKEIVNSKINHYDAKY